MKDAILVRGARQHNLKGIDVAIPRRAITVVTGPSGSGKSSLAFDTIYAEGQRRYVESLSSYARQFLERMEKPDVDSIEGISPAVAIEQKNPTKSSRSTVGTATEIYDYLRLLWARVGHTYCPLCGREMTPDTVESVTDRLLALPEGSRMQVGFPLRLSSKVTHTVVVENLRAQGFLRVVADGRTLHVDDFAAEKLDLTKVGELVVVVDRLSATAELRGRIAEAVSTAFREGEGDCAVVLQEDEKTRRREDEKGPSSALSRLPVFPSSRLLRFTERFECPNDGTRAPAPSPQLFSFNNPRGACSTCNGFGAVLEYDESLIVPNVERSVRDGAIDPWTKPRYENKRRALAEYCKKEGIDTSVPWLALAADVRHRLLHHSGRGYKGIFPFLVDLEEKRYKQYIRVFLRQYQSAKECGTCRGTKLQTDALNVRVAGLTIADVSALSIDQLRAWLDGLALSPFEQEVADHILREARDRVRFLCDVGLTYLSLHRATRTLSGGEAQRISLSNALGSSLVDTLYVLDEPSIGLHSRDLDRLLALLARLRDRGNTVLIVEHDLAAIRAADHMIELGPASGEQGGHVVFDGPVSEAADSPLTGQYLTGARTIPLPDQRRRTGPRWLTLTGAREHNLRGVDVKIPLGTLTAVTGVSGSGKSTLIHDVLYRALEFRLTGEHSAKQHLGEKVGAYDTLTGYESLDAVVLIDQEPIGRSPRSNPVTYIKAYDEIRRIFSQIPLARQRKYTASTFSFNVKGGRCEKCEGAGYLEVEMVFMADVFVPCDECAGRRFKAEVLEVTLFGKSIHDVLQLTVDQAIRFFPYEEKLGQALWQLQQVGLGYLRLGQPATTLSGGEAQRVKIARELTLSAKAAGRKLYLMDEPTTGLHLEDVRKLAEVLDRLVEAGHTVLLIEHNLDVIKLADWIIDVGPEGGDGGGTIVAMGTPEEVAATPASHTGRFLQEVLGADTRAQVNPSSRRGAAARR
ncbi:MAG: excinuclease ABC subunit UvrA [Gemmatimonadetes bacterium]|nr:excinuclease ABC subunit UvrA [Gemmatimonadota bacterium]MBK9408958.1 excinuclease ABC subunit UvrA [Gemmatimonadota bacterium]